MADSRVNAIQTLYKSLMELVEGITIKYVFKGEACETLKTKQDADQYISAVNKTDTFLSYTDYSDEEYDAVGFTDTDLIYEIRLTGAISKVPQRYQDQLLLLRRQRTIDEFVEKNNYYRTLNGLPNYELEQYEGYVFYVEESLANAYGIDPTIQVHKIQDYYNKLNGTGDYLMAILDGIGYINELKEEAEARIAKRVRSLELSADAIEEERKKYDYLNYLGANRINIVKARSAKNFQIIRLLPGTVSYRIYSAFTDIYEQCREYFMATIYIPQFRTFVDYYDNFIAMCIMIMAIQQIIMRQIPFALRRSFFDIYSVRALYEMYDMPYNLKLDTEVQDRIVQNLNMLIQAKATDKVFFDIAAVLGLDSNIEFYKYYLSKQRTLDDWGVPVVQYTKKFNPDTGEVETVPDYKAMFDVYWQKSVIKNNNFSTSFDSGMNHVDYEELTEEDPFWHEDSNVYDRVWETEYNYVESKYLGLGISYRLTDIMFKNITLMKLLMNYEDDTGALMITLPKITGGNIQVSIFDAVIALVCLMAAKHNLKGEIITIPTQVISVLDFMTNVDGGEEFLVDTLSVSLEYFDASNLEAREKISELRDLLIVNCGEDDANTFMRYIEALSTNIIFLHGEDKATAINEIYQNMNGLYTFLSWMLTKTTDRKTYQAIRTMYKAAFYSKEAKSVFTITGTETGFQRTAYTYFEFLYYRNPGLYSKLFKVDFNQAWLDYITEHGLSPIDYPYDTFIVDFERGKVQIDFSTLNSSTVDDQEIKDEFIYYNANHIISKITTVIKNLQYMNLLGDMASPLEDMLETLIRFLKSYTVELISVETIIICDMKMENIIRLFDEIAYMQKLIQAEDKINITYEDVLNNLTSTYTIQDWLKLHDFMNREVTLTVDNAYEWATNKLPFHDSIYKIYTRETLEDKFHQFFDAAIVSTTLNISELSGMKFRDAVKIYWDDEDSRDS